MPGREDFAIIRARLLGDPRAHHAAGLYVEKGLAVAATALATVVGHVAMLGVYVSRETTDGRLPGDGCVTFAVATLSVGVPRDVTRDMIECLKEAGLLREDDGPSLYVVGFRDCYEPIIHKRKANAERQRKRRARDVTHTYTTRHGATGPDRRSESGPSSPREGPSAGAEVPSRQERKHKRQPREMDDDGEYHNGQRVSRVTFGKQPMMLPTGTPYRQDLGPDGVSEIRIRGSEAAELEVPPVPAEVDQVAQEAIEKARARRLARGA